MAGLRSVIFFRCVLQRTRELENKLEPKLQIIEPMISRALLGGERGQDSDKYVPVNFVHIVVENLCKQQIDQCSVRLIELTKTLEDGSAISANISNPIRLVTSSEHLKRTTIYPDDIKNYDLAFIHSVTNKMDFSPEIRAPHAIPPSFFDDEGCYDFKIRVTGDHSPTIEGIIRISWNKNWDQLKVCKA